MRRALVLLAVLLFAGAAFAQPAVLAPCLVAGTDCGGSGSGTVTTTGTLASGQVALGSGATSITGDAGCTWTGTGATFVATFGGGIVTGAGTSLSSPGVRIGSGGIYDQGGGTLATGTLSVIGSVYSAGSLYLSGAGNGGGGKIGFYDGASYTAYLSNPSAGLLLVEDGSGNARDLRARTVLDGSGNSFGFGTPTFTDRVTLNGNTYVVFSIGGGQVGYVNALGLLLQTSKYLGLGAGNTLLTGDGVATLQLGDVNAASPVNQTLQSQGSRGGTDTNVAGGNLTIRPGAGTGSATGSSLIFQTPTAGASGTTGQTQTTRLTITEGQALFEDGTAAKPAISFASGPTTGFNTISAGTYLEATLGGVSNTYWSSGGFNLRAGLAVKFDGSASQMSGATVRLAAYTVATLPAGTVGDTAYVTDATAPTYNAALTGGGAVVVPVFYNGAAWVSH